MLSADNLVILDRDGVINHDSDNYIKSLEEWVPYPSSITAIARLTRAGYTVAVATNQSGIARGYYDEATLHTMHEHLISLVEAEGGHIAHIAYCPHGPNDNCQCRKPLPGMLIQIQQILGLESLTGSWMVGDSLRDLQAGEAVGCATALVRTGKGSKTERAGAGLEKAIIFDDLAQFVEWLVK
ncbi:MULTISPECIES: D-glycero-beta-D-manno-heptose 1,7-bisphosphate 7-phosphatase [unclassified Halomonas]|uniref:D-glycero-beta-D-manno-heptose 1,7-bisphosphate 7-phosphatase n=1 Tax=unclassified Halomonas TaxID=2609666 RepID=UPI0004885A57|nr:MULTISPECIES: D-glycero-beta-D-manno-heptose 1,7-bisphosphate 7-phosphatase [unclassified Halomonas]NAO98289.1 D-glycero-beta-D-manno-heptose 1,7-bisphosphate 7-phosphatase [Halomonas sp. MG34]PKH58367.1 D-glycero-beta-D-manno-heptose-1,7-bisphosphate 7-phosphatase [Halomonas sp. Choline-3u-9]QGQ68962.1 D-glycero-beta-D-manno-heptose 1,7-bisphosphate 7-phosphatase [Halomonas sp. PA16-9]